jgi:hypothetical protein
MNSKMEEMYRTYRTKYGGRGMEFLCPLRICYATINSICSDTWRLSESNPLGGFWRLHYIGMGD